jgi:hypothetical protein
LFALLGGKLVNIVVVDDEQDVGEIPQKKISTLVHTIVTAVNMAQNLSRNWEQIIANAKRSFGDYE